MHPVGSWPMPLPLAPWRLCSLRNSLGSPAVKSPGGGIIELAEGMAYAAWT